MTRRPVVILLSLATLLLAAASPLALRVVRGQAVSPEVGPAASIVGREGAPGASPFRHVDVFVDAGARPLAAYQFAFGGSVRVKLVGIEGGDAAAFTEPPRYDPRALVAPTPRVIVAAFSTGADLPTGRTRVARLMLRVDPGGPPPTYEARLTVAASADAKRLDGAKIELVEGALP